MHRSNKLLAAHATVLLVVLLATVLLLGKFLWNEQRRATEHEPTAEQSLVKWALDSGATLNVHIAASPAGVRGLRALKAVRKGGLLAAVPGHLVLPLGTTASTPVEAGAALLLEMSRPHSQRAPHLSVLPPPGTQLCAYNLPPRLTHLLASDELEAFVRTQQAELVSVLQGGAGEISASGTEQSEDEASPSSEMAWPLPGRQQLAWATCVATSRTIGGTSGALLLIPMLDMANHHDSSLHTIQVEQVKEWRLAGSTAADGGDLSQSRVELRAGEDVAAGQEVCICYSDVLRPDRALLLYGYVPPSSHAIQHSSIPLLAAVDQHTWGASGGSVGGSTPEAVAAEVERLRGRMAHIQHVWGYALTDASAAAVAQAELCARVSTYARDPRDTAAAQSKPGTGSSMYSIRSGLFQEDAQYAVPCPQAFALLAQLARARLDGMAAEVQRIAGEAAAAAAPHPLSNPELKLARSLRAAGSLHKQSRVG